MGYTDLNRKELSLFFLPIVALVIIGIMPNFFMDVFFLDCINILEQAQLTVEL
jgi:NADH:ubiquinone oxidoreductase subunit 4 (subunit M)